MAGSGSGTGSGAGGSAPRSPSSSSGSPRISPTVRRSPSGTPLVKRSSSVRPTNATPTTSTSTRQPQDKGSVGVGVNVFARLSKSQSPTSPTAAAAAAAAKRLQPVLVKRGRSYSKDSQKSSHSDLSSLCNGNGSGSPKLLAKTPLRSAKKRDVRNLSISPTDLGPPPKTQQTVKGQSTRNKSLTPTPITIQKRSQSNIGARPTTTPPTTTATTTTTTIATPTGNKVPAKTSPQKGAKNAAGTAVIKNVNATKTLPAGIAEESLRSGVDQTELQELNGFGLLLPAVPSPGQTPRDSKRASFSNELVCCCGADTDSCNCAAEKAPKVKRCGSHAPEALNSVEPNGCQLEQQLSQEAEPQTIEQLKDEEILKNLTNTVSSTNEDRNDTHSTGTIQPDTAEDIVAQNPALKCYVDNGYLNYERLAKCLETNDKWQEENERQTLGLAIVVQYMSKQMDMLSCQESKAKSTLEETIALLQQTQHSCEELRQQLHEKDVEWAQRQQEREHLQRTELQQAQEKVQEVQLIAKERFRELESQLQAKDEEKKEALQAYHQEIAHQLRHKQQQLTIAEQQVLQLQTRLQEHEAQEQQLREKLTRKENTHAIRLAASTQREEELQERIKSLTKELQTLRASTEHNERDLRDRLALSQDEISVLRSSSQRRSPPNSQADTSAELCRLTSEAESLRCVLELKQAEISALSKQNAELQRENDEQRGLGSRLTMLEAQNEMMRTELEAKTEKEKDIQRQMEEMQKAFNHESIKRKRLTCDKEELQYHLKQRSEQLQLVQAQLHELSNSSQDSSLNHGYSRCNSARSCLETSALNTSSTSPPASPVIKGVIERNDSVSWVLEMDDETPQVAASKLVRRAGSLRSTSERSPTQRRQLSQSANAATSNGHASSQHGPNPLSQSMSATALMRSHGSQESESARPLCRARSQSVCTKASIQRQQQLQRQRQSSDALTLPDWHVDELCSSSPQSAHNHAEMRARSSTMKLMACVDAYPKALKKFQEIQESAGEAMVSGANSEDESCSASSEDMRSSSASSTASAAGCTLSKRQKQPPSRMSIEEALMLEQVNSLNGTPMEVSWSEDAADADVAAAAHPLA
ncbi:trichohyalin isoform X1 [Drosophila novamexicana]|uniref:trichohyalin isoform X1 n=1 Tax=Drosophila novamexicana TaxID=47314 RepID=UPI0011E5AF9B|nr:trichohyalin isoform X1 [Drosophila novamexicana]